MNKRIVFAWVFVIIYFLALPGVNKLKFDTICCFTVGWTCGYILYPNVRYTKRKIVRFIREYRSKKCA